MGSCENNTKSMTSRQSTNIRQRVSTTDPSTTVNRDGITDFNELRENVAHKLELDDWFHLTSLQSLHIFNVDIKSNGNLSIRHTIHVNIELKCTVYGANDDIVFTVKLCHWPQLQSLIEQFGREVKRECDTFEVDETCHSDDVKDDCLIDRKDEAVAFDFCARKDVETELVEPQLQSLVEIVKEEFTTVEDVRSQKSFLCPECGKTFTRKARLNMHRRLHKKHFCSKSNESYERNVDSHMRKRHSDDGKSFECHICRRTYTKLKGLKRHMRSKHVAKTTGNTRSKEVNRTKVTCPICQKEFASKDSLKCHKYRSHDRRNWKECLICKRSYDNLKRHMQNVHSEDSKAKNLICHICGAAYKVECGLKKHMETKHSDDGEFFCHICKNGKNYRSKWYLKKHFAIVHAFVEQEGREYSNAFECHLCDERFPSSNTLRQHVRMKHNGVEETRTRLQPDIPDKKLSVPNHTIEPTGKTYICPECGRPFSRPSQLKVHLNQHSGVKEQKNVRKKACSMCDKQYVVITDLRLHMVKIHGAILPIKDIQNQGVE